MRSTLLLIILSLLTSCGEVPLYETGSTVSSFSDGFEAGLNEPWSSGAARDDSITIVTNPVRLGTNAIRFKIYPGDYAQGGSRAEISFDNNDPIGSEAWYGWSVYLETNYIDSGLWQIMGQWHDQPDYLQGETWDSFPGNSPPVSIGYTNGLLFLNLLYQSSEEKSYLFTNINKGEWIDVVVHIKWSLQNDGFAEMYINGNRISDPSNNVNIVYGKTFYNRAGNYIKMGIYRGPEAAVTNTLYYDEFRIGNSYAEVALP